MSLQHFDKIVPDPELGGQITSGDKVRHLFSPIAVESSGQLGHECGYLALPFGQNVFFRNGPEEEGQFETIRVGCVVIFNDKISLYNHFE